MRQFIFTTLVVLLFFPEKGTGECERIHFVHPSEKDFAYIHLLNAVFIKTNQIKDNFPVYKDEKGEVFFSYVSQSALFYFSVGSVNFKNFTGLIAQESLKTFKIPVLTDLKMFVFRYFLHGKIIEHKIRMRCVTSMTECHSGVMTSKRGHFHFIKETPVRFKNKRKVYIDGNYRLQYNTHPLPMWRIFDITLLNTSNPYLYTVWTNAIKPEFITEKWVDKNLRKVDMNIECLGTGVGPCSSSLCQNAGSCHSNSIGDSWCTCKYGFIGKYCQRKSSTTCPNDSQKTENNEIGAIKNQICSSKSEREFQTLFCNSSRYWDGNTCLSQTSIPSVQPVANDQSNSTNLKSQLVVSLTICIFAAPFVTVLLYWVYAYMKNKTIPIARTMSNGAHAVICICAIYIVIYQTTDLQKHHPEGCATIHFIAVNLLPISYLFTVVESLFYSKEMKILNLVHLSKDEGHACIFNICGMPPKIRFHMKCFHNNKTDDCEQSNRKPKRTDKITWKGSKNFIFDYWHDETAIDNLPTLSEHVPILKITIKHDISIRDEETRQQFEEEKELFIDTNRNHDKKYHFYTTYAEDTGVKENFLLCDKQLSWMNAYVYLVLTLLCCSLPYRIFFNRKVTDKTFIIKKTISNISPITEEDMMEGDSPPPYQSIMEYDKPPDYDVIFNRYAM